MKISVHLWVSTSDEEVIKVAAVKIFWRRAKKKLWKCQMTLYPESDDWDNPFSEIGLDFLRWWQRGAEEKSIDDESQSLWTISVECSPHCHHRALGLMIWIAFQLYSLWIGYSRKNAFIYWHNFGNRLVINVCFVMRSLCGSKWNSEEAKEKTCGVAKRKMFFYTQFDTVSGVGVPSNDLLLIFPEFDAWERKKKN